MDNIKTKDRDNADLDIAAKDIGGVKFPRNIITDPAGNDQTLATEATLAALLTAANAIKAAAEALNGKTTAVNTGAIAGSVSVSNLAALAGLPVTGDFYPATQPVSGTFWQATQPVSFTWAGLTDAQLRETPVAMSVDALPLPAGAATQTTLANIDSDIGAPADAAASSDTGGFSLIALLKRLLQKTASLLTAVPSQDAAASPVRLVGQEVITAGFSAVGASVLDSAFNAPIVGTGVGYSQAAGALAITTGTTANAEFLARSARSVRGSHRLRFTLTASQRIANQNLAVLMADLVGEGLAFTCVSATQVNVGIPTHGFTAQNVGQFCLLGGIVGAAGVPGRYAIASIIDANTVQFTVAGWPASGSGTLTAFGRNYIRVLATGTTATNAAVDAQRNGWATGDTTATINTTASPGTLVQAELTGREVFFSDALRATSTTPNFTTRASRYENIPDSTVDFYLFLWSYNGTSAPASTTTWTLGHASVESFPNVPVYLQGLRSTGAANPLPVAVQGTAAVSLATNTPTLAAGTNLAGDVGTQYRANATGAASIVNIASPLTPAGATIKGSAGRLLALSLVNTSAGVRWVKIFNATTVTMGTTSAVIDRPIPAGGTMEFQMEGGLGFATGIMIAVTSARGQTDNTTTGLGVGDVCGFAAYA